MTLWPWPLTFWPWVFHVQCFSCPTHIPIFIILRLSVTELWIAEFDHISVNRHCHCACAVSRELSSGGKWSTFLKSLTPICLFTCHFQGATTKIKPCYRRKIAFSHYEGYKVYCARAVSRDRCIGGPPKPHVTILSPIIAYSLYNFYRATTTIKGSFILEHPHMLKRFSAAKNSQVKIGPQNGGFSEI